MGSASERKSLNSHSISGGPLIPTKVVGCINDYQELVQYFTDLCRHWNLVAKDNLGTVVKLLHSEVPKTEQETLVFETIMSRRLFAGLYLPRREYHVVETHIGDGLVEYFKTMSKKKLQQSL